MKNLEYFSNWDCNNCNTYTPLPTFPPSTPYPLPCRSYQELNFPLTPIVAISNGKVVYTQYPWYYRQDNLCFGCPPTEVDDYIQFTGISNTSGNYIVLDVQNYNISWSLALTWVAVVQFTKQGAWQRLFDFGNGAARDNVLFTITDQNKYRWQWYIPTGEYEYPQSIFLDSDIEAVYDRPRLFIGKLFADDLESTLSLEIREMTGQTIYKNTQKNPPNPTWNTSLSRSSNYVGKSNWINDPYSNMKLYHFYFYNYTIPDTDTEFGPGIETILKHINCDNSTQLRTQPLPHEPFTQQKYKQIKYH